MWRLLEFIMCVNILHISPYSNLLLNTMGILFFSFQICLQISDSWLYVGLLDF